MKEDSSKVEFDELVQKLHALHKPFKIYGDCGHDHEEDEPGVAYVEEIGWTCEFLYEICTECCTVMDDEQTEECASGHDHGDSKPICRTIGLLS